MRARTLSVLVARRWKRATMAPSNSVPRPTFTVVGENAFHTIVSQIFVAMKREIPDPRPYPYKYYYLFWVT